MLLERAFPAALRQHSDSLLNTTISCLESIYQQYRQSLCSPTISLQLNRYTISLFAILSIILRLRSFNSKQNTLHQNGLDQHIFLHTVRFAQLPDETVIQWLQDPISIVDSSAEAEARNAVRIAILAFAVEVTLSSIVSNDAAS